MKQRSRPRKTAKLSESIHHQLNMYAIAASAAGVGMLALAQPAEARIIYTPAHVKIPIADTVPLDLNHDGIADFSFVNTGFGGPSNSTQFMRIAPALVNPENRGRGNRGFASALQAGVGIGTGGQNFSNALYMAVWFATGKSGSGNHYSGQWWNSGKGEKDRYLGLKFTIKDKVHFGWARLNVIVKKGEGVAHFSGVLTGYAYETIPNKPIIAGQTKGQTKGTDAIEALEPASLGRLAQGSAGFAVWSSGN